MGWNNIRINEKSYERYKRSYPRVQSLIAESTSIIQLFFMLYYFLGNYYYNIGMYVEIMKNILDKKNKNIINKNKKINLTFDKDIHNQNLSETIDKNDIQRSNSTIDNICIHTKNNIKKNNGRIRNSIF